MDKAYSKEDERYLDAVVPTYRPVRVSSFAEKLKKVVKLFPNDSSISTR